MNKQISVLYITYDGLCDPLGQSQIIPYLKGLARKNVKIIILSFEKKSYFQKSDLLRDTKQSLSCYNIKWRYLKYHRSPSFLSSLYNMVWGYINGLILINKYQLKIVHSRGYIPGFIALLLKKSTGIKFIFDMRGFWAEEKVDARLWGEESIGYRITKSLERKMLNSADQIVVLTEKAKLLLTKNNSELVENIEVIATCVDLERFKPQQGEKYDSLRNKIVILYSGSIGTFYGFRDAADFFRVLYNRIKNSFFLTLINNQKEKAEDILRSSDLPSDSYKVLSLPHREVADWLKKADLSLMFYHRNNSYTGCCPTKFSESLASGVAVVANKNIGDCDDIIKKEKVGFVIGDFTDVEYAKTIEKFLPLLEERDLLRKRCRSAAERLFSLDSGVEKYLDIYQRL